MSSDVVIQVEHVSKCYKMFAKPQDRLKQSILRSRQLYQEFWALKNVSLTVYKGETVGIVGSNGSGKSTLLRIIAGTLAPTSGTVSVRGRVAALLELGSGFNPEFTGRENIYMNAALLGVTKAEARKLFDEIVEFSGIYSFIDQPIKTYSSGMIVRLAFAVQAVIPKEVLIVDEALAVGDEKFQSKCFAKIEEFKKQGGTILFVSHSGSTVVELCDRAMMLDHGEALITGKSKDVVSLYQKLQHAPDEKKSALRAEILAYGNRNTSNTQVCDGPTTPAGASGVGGTVRREAMFDPKLVPDHPIRYESRGAFISNSEIVTLDGKRVNVLISGDSYVWRYRVRFYKDFKHVRFGMMLKTSTGVELGGASTDQAGAGIERVRAGDEYRIEFTLSPNLNQGVYFLNAGVLAMCPEGEVYVDRILDAEAFKIIPRQDTVVTGLVDFGIHPQVFYTSNEQKENFPVEQLERMRQYGAR
ncbi:MAG: ABC transporter ATP-binding protein [Alicyclobacillus sp.]|nr:ABC transporter ATP-binding protein [Alicyclobacillus sp.]